MKHRSFKNLPQDISLLGLGCMRFPTLPDENIDEEQSLAIIDYLYKSGVNYFDTAYPYHHGKSEAFVGKALSAYPRDSFYLASKMPVWELKTEADAPRIFEEQLARCKTDYFDFYLCHALDAERYELIQRLNLLPFLQKMKKAGKIRHIGFSFHDKPPVLKEICNGFNWEFAQLQINPLDWDVYQSQEQYEILVSHNIPCIIMEPVRGGQLTDLGPEANKLLTRQDAQGSIASWSMRFSAGLSNTLTVLSGMGSLAQAEDNIKTFCEARPLSQSEQQALDEAMQLYKESKAIGCTACRYCMPCPQGVDIPGIFKLFNHCNIQRMVDFKEEYKSFDESAKAAHCVDCGLCEKVCPQHLSIPQLLKKIDAGQPPL